MKIRFRTKRLAKDCADDRSRRRAFGADRVERLRKRLTTLLAAQSLEDVRHAPGRFKPLRGDRKGRFSADLDHPYRLIFEPVIDDVGSASGPSGLDWTKIAQVRILGIEDYHG